jgi:excisionase family DNA binding protein
MDQPLFLTYKQAGQICNVSVSLIRKLKRAGKIRVVHFGRSARIPLSELQNYTSDAKKG